MSRLPACATATYRDGWADDCSCDGAVAALTACARCAAGADWLGDLVDACNLGWRGQQQRPLHYAQDLDSVHDVRCSENVRACTVGLHACEGSVSRAEPAAGCLTKLNFWRCLSQIIACIDLPGC